MGRTDHVLKAAMSLPLGQDRVFGFFADVMNLQRITPAKLQFRVLTPTPLTIEAGTTIDYQLKLFQGPVPLAHGDYALAAAGRIRG